MLCYIGLWRNFLSSAFTANVIQFVMDQLHIMHNECAHEEKSVLFVHWYVWTSYLGIFTCQMDWDTLLYSDSDHLNGLLLLSSSLITLIVIGRSLYFAYNRERHLFPVQITSTNLYCNNLVYQVIKYSVQQSWQQTIFTIFSRLNFDMGKEKHGGPFKAKQVEDVKVYAKTFCILLTLGPIFTVNIAASNIIPFIFTLHMDDFLVDNFPKSIFSYHGSLISTLVVLVVVIPLYIFMVGPSVYIPGRLKRIGIGIVLIIFSLICPLLIDIIGHIRHPYSTIFFLASDFNHDIDYPDDPYIHISSWFIVFSYVLNAFAHIFLDIATYEFICITSPHSMEPSMPSKVSFNFLL